ncbi:MAG: low molecular weight phosphotyrosine protein phosphatase [Paludibacterium sp.]|uniref:low molecular weight protein-tyrosine-phosphatase n=1 Tax=Paludibacterium sp. TaxID=1917523 RepID=UPI0025FD5335|nr:low molecular weight protein-tyrosine-phosphatase [Paludibacterium sp.]MBV8049471.1 low molecular weight phosphotyrosine protein phosphatase [Paludibacterium sp.]MBV8648721.1 low molecular weight phosphotyrosine protein phosphatase [Paludibacterium sp.]
MIDATRGYAVLFVCHGNICRSPTAEAVMRRRAARAGLGAVLRVDSAGTSDCHVGEAPDRRSQRAAGQRGYDLSALVARQVADDDFERFDLILAADRQNLASLRRRCPEPLRHKLALMLDVLPDGGQREVPDPYFGGPSGFDRVLDLLEAACDGWIEKIRAM